MSAEKSSTFNHPYVPGGPTEVPRNASGIFAEVARETVEEATRLIRAGVKRGMSKMPTDIQSLSKTLAALGSVGYDMARSKARSVMERFAEPQPVQTEDGESRIEVVDGKRVVVWLVHPTNYRKDGTPRKWAKQILPTNAIGQLNALMPEKLDDGTEDGVPVQTHFLEDTVQPFNIDDIDRSMSGEGNKGVVMLSGVQTNQWPRAMDLASLCQDRGIPVIAGGYHVRADLPVTRKQADELGMSLAIGEAESMLDDKPFLEAVLKDLWEGKLQPEYRQEANPDITTDRISRVIPAYQELMINPTMTTMESSRGCPLPCSFCTIRTIGGTKVRARNPESMDEWLTNIHDHDGIRTIFITDDNFSKSKQRFEILEVLKQKRKEGREFNAMVQVDTMATRGQTGSRFVEACQEAGVHSVFLGIESVDPETLKTMNKPQNKPERYKEMIDDWHRANIMTQCGFIIGNPGEKPGVGRRSAETLVDMGIDVAAAYVRTPLPGSVDYHELHKAGLITEADFNLYDSHSAACISFPDGLTPEELQWEYDEFYRNFFAIENFGRLGRNLEGHTLKSAIRQWIWYRYSFEQGDHPMYSGFKPQPADFLRSQFPHNRNLQPSIEDLAPKPEGPGAPHREKSLDRNRLKVIS